MTSKNPQSRAVAINYRLITCLLIHLQKGQNKKENVTMAYSDNKANNDVVPQI